MLRKKLLSSSVFQKYLMAMSGLGLVGFVITHLLGNLLLYKADGTAFNRYAFGLENLGTLLYIAEIGLLAIFILHVVTAIGLSLHAKAARPEGYAVTQSKGGASKAGASASYMKWSGTILLIFIILHVIHFKYGASIADGYTTQIEGHESRDLYRLVSESFHNVLYVVLYSGVMIFLGMHVRHGFWSAFQSLGAMNKKYSAPVYGMGLGLAILLSVGFLGIPIWIYFH